MLELKTVAHMFSQNSFFLVQQICKILVDSSCNTGPLSCYVLHLCATIIYDMAKLGFHAPATPHISVL